MIKNKNIVNQKLTDVNPLICGMEICTKNHMYGPAIRSYYLLHYVVSGRGTVTTPRGFFKVEKGEMFIIRPYETNMYKADDKEPWTYIWIGFEAKEKYAKNLFKSDTVFAPELEKVFRKCIEHPDLTENVPGYEMFLTGKIYEILSFLSSIPSITFSNYVSSAVSIMESEYSQNISVSSIAERLHLNRSYFTSMFAKVTGKSPGKYLSEIRMEKAMDLISNHGFNVTVTAKSVGFPDVYTFSRAFKNHFGSPPNAFLKSKITKAQ